MRVCFPFVQKPQRIPTGPASSHPQMPLPAEKSFPSVFVSVMIWQLELPQCGHCIIDPLPIKRLQQHRSQSAPLLSSFPLHLPSYHQIFIPIPIKGTCFVTASQHLIVIVFVHPAVTDVVIVFFIIDKIRAGITEVIHYFISPVLSGPYPKQALTI